jgi:type VI protein secretion system component Hcp
MRCYRQLTAVLLRAFVLLACLSGFFARADYSVYMFIQNIPGEFTDASHTNWIALRSISQQEVSKLIAPGVKSCVFGINKVVDKSSPLLMLRVAQGAQIPPVHLQLIDNLNTVHVYDIFLTNAFVTGLSQTSSDPTFEDISFKFGQITWTYTFSTGKTGLTTATFDLTQTNNPLANQTYQGNGNTNSGGAIGDGTLLFTNNANTIYGTFTRGAGTFSNALVLYIDNNTGGFSDTSGFNDTADGITRALSGFDGANRSLLTFTNASKPFSPSYAIALAPIVGSGSGRIYRLQNGGFGSQNLIGSANLTPLATGNAYTYKFSFGISQIGLPALIGQSFRFLGTYVTTTGARSTEVIGGNINGVAGWNPFSTLDVATYTITAPAATAVAITMTYDPQVATVTFSWPVTSTPYVLQQNADISTTDWTTVTNGPTVIGNQNQVVVPASVSSPNFYRLKY